MNDLEQPAFDMYVAILPLDTGIMLCSHQMLGCKHLWLLQRLCTCTIPACTAFNVGRLIMACADGTAWMHIACRSWDS